MMTCMDNVLYQTMNAMSRITSAAAAAVAADTPAEIADERHPL